MSLVFQKPISAGCGGCRNTTVAGGATVYVGGIIASVPNATEAVRDNVVSVDGVINHGYVRTSGSQTNTMTATWRKNRTTNTSLVVTIAGGSGAGLFSDLVNSFSVVAGDTVSIDFTNGASTSAGIIGTACLFHGEDSTWESPHAFLGCTGNAGNVAPGTNYADFVGSVVAATENTRQNIVPADGFLKNYLWRISSTQPATGSLVLTVRVNGSSTPLAVTIAAGSAAGSFSDNVNVATIAAGDTVGVQVVNNASSNSSFLAHSVYYCGLSRYNSRPRMAFSNGTGNDTVNASTSEYISLVSGASWNSSEAQRLDLVSKAGSFCRFYYVSTTAQPATGSLVLTVKKELADTAIVITIAANSAAGVFSDIINRVNFSAGDRCGIRGTNNASSASCTGRTSIFFTESI